MASGSFEPSTSAETVRDGDARPYCARSPGWSVTTSSASSFSRLVRIDSTAEVSAGAANGDTTFQPVPSFATWIVSPPLAASVTCFAFALSTASTVTFSRSPSRLGSCLRSTNQM